MQTPLDWTIVNKNTPLPAPFQGTSKIDMDELNYSSDSTLLVDKASPMTQQVAKKRKSEVLANPVRILNRNAGASSSTIADSPSMPKVIKKLPTVVPHSTKVVKVSGENYTIRQIKSPTSHQLVKQEKLQVAAVEQLELEEPSAATTIEAQQMIPIASGQPSEALWMDSIKQIAEIKELLTKNKAQAASATPMKSEPESFNISQSHMNKVQLFNGIKRYLSPSMNALLRIELFSAPNREYKKDEKIICQELLSLGEKTYDFLAEEWRLRLPAKEDAQRWIDEQITDEDDAS